MSSWKSWLAVLCVGTAAATAIAEPARRPMTIEDLWAVQRVSGPRLSPDGSLVAFTVTSYDMEENKGNRDLWLVPFDGSATPRRLTWNENNDSNPVWSPDGRRLAFVSKRDEDSPSQVYVLRLDGGEAEPLTDLPIGVQDPRWFPDGTRIAFVASTWPDLGNDFAAIEERVKQQKEDKVKVKVSESRLVRYWDHYLTDGRQPHLFVVDLETKQVTDLMAGSERLLSFWSAAGSWDISPDGRELAFSANSTKPPYTKLNYDVFVMPSTGGEARNLTADNPAWDGTPRYSPDGRYLVYGRNRRPETAPDFTRLVRLDRESGRAVELTADWDRQPAGWVFADRGRKLVFHAQDHGRSSVYSMPVAGGTPRLEIGGGTTRGLHAGPGGRLVMTIESVTRAAEILTARLGGEDHRIVTAFNDVLFEELDPGTLESVEFRGADGEPVQMFVLHPPGFDREREAKWPLVVLIHGGPHGAWLDSFHYRWNMALWASRGHVVAGVNFHGSTGFGQAFAESILGAHGDKPFTDVMKALDHMLGRGYIDERRVAAAGGSYGGYLVAWIAGHTDRFAALINHAGVYDLMAQFSSDYTWGRPNNYGAAPWQDPARIDRWSPSRFAERFETPMLVIHGEKDYRVPYTQGLNVYGVLAAKGVPARLVVFPDENHWILKPQSAVVWWNEVFDWLERYTGDGS